MSVGESIKSPGCPFITASLTGEAKLYKRCPFVITVTGREKEQDGIFTPLWDAKVPLPSNFSINGFHVTQVQCT